jgi:hypothetical protein
MFNFDDLRAEEMAFEAQWDAIAFDDDREDDGWSERNDWEDSYLAIPAHIRNLSSDLPLWEGDFGEPPF